MNANGTDDFHLVSNSLQSFQSVNFTTLAPGNGDYAALTSGAFSFQSGSSDSLVGHNVVIDGYTTGDTNPADNKVFINNGGGGGLGVNNGNLDTNETVLFKFNDITGDTGFIGDQNSVTVGIGKSNGSFETFIITLKDDSGNVIASELIKQTDGTPIIVDAAHWGTANGAVDQTGPFSNFGEIDVTNVGGSSFTYNTHSYDYTSNSYDSKLLVTSLSSGATVGDTTLVFDPSVTDGDGDTTVSSTNMSVSLVGTTNASGGYTLTADSDPAGSVLVGSSGNDTLISGLGADTMTGGAGSDTFKYTVASDSTFAAHDTITDFVHGSDIIDFSAISSITAVQGLVSGPTASVAADSVAWYNDGSGNTIVVANTTGAAEVATSAQMMTLLTGVTASDWDYERRYPPRVTTCEESCGGQHSCPPNSFWLQICV